MLSIRSLSWITLITSLLFTSACGFQLRGDYNLPSHLSPMAIVGIGKHDEIRRELTALLKASNIQITHKATEASSVLSILKTDSKNRVLSVDDRAKHAESELYESVKFEVTNRQKSTLVKAQTAKASRTYINTSTQVLGKELEKSMLLTDIRRDLAARIVSRIKAQAK